MSMTISDNYQATIQRWFLEGDDGDWVGMFENQDLGHPDIGQRFMLFFDAAYFDGSELMKATAPDTQQFGIGWRYLLIGKYRSPEEALEAWSDWMLTQ